MIFFSFSYPIIYKDNIIHLKSKERDGRVIQVIKFMYVGASTTLALPNCPQNSHAQKCHPTGRLIYKEPTKPGSSFTSSVGYLKIWLNSIDSFVILAHFLCFLSETLGTLGNFRDLHIIYFSCFLFSCKSWRADLTFPTCSGVS